MKKMIMAISLVVLVGILIGGCGERTETSRYYYSPAWTRDGKIILLGSTQSVRKDFLGGQLGSSYSEYLVTIYPTGTGESDPIYDVTADPPYALSCSPTRDYVAYLEELRNGFFGKIIIRSLSPEAFTGMREFELTFLPRIKSFDWSSDGNQIVYCTTDQVRRRDWNDFNGSTDQLVTTEANIEFVTWKYGGRIAFVYLPDGERQMSLIYPDGSGRLDVSPEASVAYPSISAVDTNEVYGIAGGNLVKVDVNAATPSSTEVASSFTGSIPRLSQDASLVTYSKPGENTGIYILYTGTGTEEQIK